MAAAPSATTSDTLYDGAVTLLQPATGYRVNVDALLLAAFAAEGRHARLAVDLGSGVGAVALGLHHLGATTRAALIERETELNALARTNVEAAGLRAEVYERDLARGLPEELAQRADLVVANPPFFSSERGRSGAPSLKTRARFGELEPFLAAAAKAVNGTRARVAFVYPARELTEFCAAATQVALIPKRVRLVHADASTPARVALIELQRAKPGGLVVLPPLIEWDEPGVRSAEVSQILRGEPLNTPAPADDRKRWPPPRAR